MTVARGASAGIALAMAVAVVAWAPRAGAQDENAAAVPAAPAAPPELPAAAPPVAPPPVVAAGSATAPVIVAQPAPAPPPAPPLLVAPGDPETKADFQHVWLWPEPSPTWHLPFSLAASAYGLLRFDYIDDSTQGLAIRASSDIISRPGTILGERGSSQFTSLNSRVGAKLGNPDPRVLGAMLLLELGARSETERFGVRLAYLGVRTPIVDVLIGRYHDVFGWGGRGFAPNTLASLGVPGEIYRQRQQLRLSHVFRFSPVDFEIALAGVQPVQSSADTAEGQLGFRLAVNRWAGAAQQGAAPPAIAPAQLGLSWVRRRFEVPAFTAAPSNEAVVKADGGGAALNIFLPIVPAHPDDLSNALSFNLEASRGTGIADFYSGFTGGAFLPALPNPQSAVPVPVYAANIQPSILTYDVDDGRFRTINWTALVLGLRYHAPFAGGRRLWVSGTWSVTSSDNLAVVTPVEGRAGVAIRRRYWDVNAFVALWRGLELAVSYQSTRQTMGDGVSAENQRVQTALAFAF